MATCCMTILHYEMMAMVEVYWQMTRTYMPSVRVVIENVESKPFARTFQTILWKPKAQCSTEVDHLVGTLIYST
jgi:hypothetical protein